MVLKFYTKFSMFRFIPDRLLRGSTRLGFVFLLALLSWNSASGQMVRLAGTTFDPTNPADAATRAYIGMTDIVQYGFQTGALTVPHPITTSADPDEFHTGTQKYAITDNPYNLDNARYQNLPAGSRDYQLIFSPAAAGQTNILTYKVNGLAPATPVEVRVTYCNPISPTLNTCTGNQVSVRGVINPDAGNMNAGLEGTQVTYGNCQTLTITQATGQSNPIGADGVMNFRLAVQQNGTCYPIAIKSIEVWGTPQPKAIVAEGTEVCAGEQITLQTPIDYNGTYQWEYSTNGGSSWSNVPGGNRKSSLFEAATVGTYSFRAKITPTNAADATGVITSQTVTVNAIACCTENGAPASRKTIYYDDFGTLNMSDPTGRSYFVWDYSNPLSPVQVPKTTTTPFRWRLDEDPLGATFVGAASTATPLVIEDGQYTVAAYLTGYSAYNGVNGAMLGWANRVTGPTTPPTTVSYDHSGTLEGGALFLNCPPNTGGQTLYKRTIPGLCTGKQLFFECWIAVFTNEPASGHTIYNGVDVMVRLTDQGDASNILTLNETATRQADGGGVWKKISGTITLNGTNGVLMEIINNKNTSISGNDLVLDDIKIMACSPPPVDAYFDIPTLSQSEAICNEAVLPLYTLPSTMLKNYFGNAPMYLFQWTRTPNVVTSWQNLGSPVAGPTGENYNLNNPRTHAAFAGLTDGGKVYFRVIAATSAVFTLNNNFQGVNNEANINDPCRNYSVSEAIEATINCPLPVELVSFSGTTNGQTNQLTWTTSSERNNHYFIIERSTDGANFSAIGKVEGKGNSTNFETYLFADETPANGITYYRLKQVDFDGAFVYSKAISIFNELSDITIYPNPNSGSFTISLLAPGQSYRIDIVDAQGKVIYSSEGAEVSEPVQVNDIPVGFYLVRVLTGNQLVTKKLIVR